MTDSSDRIVEALFERLNALPGGAYYAQMLRNNAEFMAAIRRIDPADPQATERAMSAALAALGLDSSAMTAMMSMIERLQRAGFDPEKSDPADLLRAMGTDPSLLAGLSGLGARPAVPQGPTTQAAARAPAPPSPVVLASPTPTALPPTTPAWDQVAQDAARLIATGNERRGFELLCGALDHDASSRYDPSDFERFAGLTSLLEILAAESTAAGRQVPVRFGSLFQRYALFVGFAEPSPPSANPEFTAWCAAIVEHATRR